MTLPTPEAIRDELVRLDPERAADVSRWEVEIGEDSVGDPAVFVTVVYRDDRLYAAWKRRREYTGLIEAGLTALLPGRWPYVTLSAESVAIDPERAPA
ncbi:MAG: hypothetical protein ACKVT1_04275 [Dehalococcoidia bacterium]